MGIENKASEGVFMMARMSMTSEQLKLGVNNCMSILQVSTNCILLSGVSLVVFSTCDYTSLSCALSLECALLSSFGLFWSSLLNARLRSILRGILQTE